MKNIKQIIIAILTVLMLFGPNWPFYTSYVYAQPPGVNPPKTNISLKTIVETLLNETTDNSDTDLDGLPDSIELVLGTDPENSDSDFDRLSDFWEVDNDLDPLDPDSNFDGLPDYYEVNNANFTDIDEDGIENAWDFDNDGDGVNDEVDLSPFSKTDVDELFHFDITTNGNPSYITFQINPKNKEHLKLFGQSWDWPDGDHEGAIQDWDNSKEDVSVIPVLQLSVNIEPEASEVIMNGIIVDGNVISIPLMPVIEHGNIVAFAGRMIYPTSTPENLNMDVSLIWKIIGKNDLDSDNLEEDTLLVTYKGEFAITGMSIEESYGVDTEIFYSQDVNQSVAANLILAYQFLRNSENHVADMENILFSNNVTVEHQSASFDHRDAALVSLANEMIPAALDTLPPDQNLPVITIFEDRSMSFDLSEFNPVAAGSFNIDLTFLPVMTTRTLKTTWYNTLDREALEMDNVMAKIHELGENEATTYSLMTLMLYWNTGEQSLDGAGIPQADPGDDYELVPDVVDDLVGGALSGLEILYKADIGLAGLRSYKSIKLLQSKGWKISLGGQSIPDLAKMGKFKKFKTWVKQCERIQDNVNFFKKMDKVLEGLDTAALFIDAGFSAYSVISLSQMTDLDAMRLNTALMQITMEYYYSLMLFMIGSIPYVGWLIAIGIELSDVFGDWSDDFIDWLVDGLSDVDYTVTPDVDLIGDPNLTIDDKNANGLDVGDRIDYRGRLNGKVSGSANYWSLVSKSEIYPYYKVYAPAGSSSVTGYPYQREMVTGVGNRWLPITAPHWTQDSAAAWRACEYESGVWIEPAEAMPNFPVYIELNSIYQLWYEWSYYSFFIFDWGWKYHQSHQDGEMKVGGFTIYVDVMPGSIEDFACWRGITPLDNDGDGALNSSESQSNLWLYDTDSDGLNDKYEMDIGIDPINYDTDGDGLIDWFEIQYFTDPLNKDTDGDGLKDSIELSGWVITFTYEGQEYRMHVNSDPTVPDSDSDGVDDSMEYWSDLNPRASDSDGDGVNDIANPKYLEGNMELEFERAWNIEPGPEVKIDGLADGELVDIDVDAQEYLYILRNRILKNSGMWDYMVYKYYAPTGDYVTKTLTISRSAFSAALNPSADILYIAYDGGIIRANPNNTHYAHWMTDVLDTEVGGPIAVDKDGYVYVAQTRTTRKISKLRPDAYLATEWGSQGYGPQQFQVIEDMSVDNKNGYFYVVDNRGTYTRIAKFTTDGVYLGDLLDGYNFPKGIDVDAGGNVYVADTYDHEILVFNEDGMYLNAMGEYGDAEGSLNQPFRVIVGYNNDVYIADRPTTFPLGRVQRFSLTQGQGERPDIPVDIPDPDEDGLLNEEEMAGWYVTFTDATGTYTIAVTSDPLLSDTDLDGLTDFQEYEISTNPQDADTDSDGLSDLAEWESGLPKTNPLHFDTDGDGLSDGMEITYGSNPNSSDTDGDELPDSEEFMLGADPNKSDTDGDGLNDSDEYEHNTSPTSPDSDGDFMFDGQEIDSGTDPNNNDTDGDGISDGIENSVYNTNPGNNDSDGDGLDDGSEIEMGLNPLSSDTDEDGIPDGTEIEEETNPWSADSDYDGVPDNEEQGNTPPVVTAGSDTTINEGGTITVSGSFTDPDMDNWSGGVDYGDGSDIEPVVLEPDKSFTLNHIYTDNGNYTVTVKVADDHGGLDSDTALVTVNNIVPSVDAGEDGTAYEGNLFTGSGSFTDPGEDSWTATVDYGDNSDVLPLTLNPDKSFTLSHIYSDNGTYSVTVTVIDDDGGSSIGTIMVNVENMAPIVNAGSDLTVNLGEIVSIDASFTDAGTQDTHTAATDWGDGASASSGVVNESGGFGSVTGSHEYLWPGIYTVVISVTDNDNATDTDSLLVSVIAAPELLINMLIDDVLNLNIPGRTKKSLIKKLRVAMKRIKDSNKRNDVAAIHSLKAFINHVEAQREKKIMSEDADELTAKAQIIIELLEGEIKHLWKKYHHRCFFKFLYKRINRLKGKCLN